MLLCSFRRPDDTSMRQSSVMMILRKHTDNIQLRVVRGCSVVNSQCKLRKCFFKEILH